jgi:hypothetical protein
MSKPKPKVSTSRDRVAAHRVKLRKAGLHPIQIWVPDVKSPEFLAEARRQSLRVARARNAQDDQAFVDSHVNEIYDDIERAER